MNVHELQSSLRRVELADYPELSAYTRDQIYGHGDQLSPGALFLAARMARELHVKPGDVVLDVGCGLGESSLFLAECFGVRVVAVDESIPARMLSKKFAERGYRDSTFPLTLDITKPLPFAEDYFDAVFCMTSIHYFGLTPEFFRHLLRYLKTGGRFVVGNTCFDKEVSPDEVPSVYRALPPGSVLDSWEGETARYHSPDWWRRLLMRSQTGDILECVELEDGPAMWEDKLAYDLELSGWSQNNVDGLQWKVDQILFGREHTPRLTFFAAALEKK